MKDSSNIAVKHHTLTTMTTGAWQTISVNFLFTIQQSNSSSSKLKLLFLTVGSIICKCDVLKVSFVRLLIIKVMKCTSTLHFFKIIASGFGVYTV